MPSTPAGRDRGEGSDRRAAATEPTDAVRDRLLAAAHELVIEEGDEAPTIQAVARQAGLTNGAVYANFATKHELLVEVALRCWSQLPDAHLMRLGTEAGIGDDRQLGLDELAVLLAEQQSAPPGPEYRLLAEVTGGAMRHRDTELLLRACVERLRFLVARAIDRAKAQGTIDERLSTEALVAVITDLYLGTVTAKALRRPQPRQSDVLALIEKLTGG